MTPLISLLSSLLTRGMTVLDLGAGDGRHAATLVSAGMQVVAVERRDIMKEIPGVENHRADIREWITALPESTMFDGVLVNNALQFFGADYARSVLFPFFTSHVRQDGVVAMATFFRDPIPGFERPCASLWSAARLAGHFSEPEWDCWLLEQFESEQEGLDGIVRQFFMTQLIAQRR